MNRFEMRNRMGLTAFVPPGRAQLRGLGAIDATSAEASVDVAIAVGETRVLMALLSELAKVDSAKYRERAAQVQQLVVAVGDLNQQIATLGPAAASTWQAALEQVTAQMGALEQQLHADLAAARMKRDVWAVGLTAGSLILAGWGGWYVFSHRRKKQFT